MSKKFSVIIVHVLSPESSAGILVTRLNFRQITRIVISCNLPLTSCSY